MKKKLFCILSDRNKVVGIYSSVIIADRDCFYLNTHLSGSYYVQSAPFGHDSVSENLSSIESCHLRNILDV